MKSWNNFLMDVGKAAAAANSGIDSQISISSRILIDLKILIKVREAQHKKLSKSASLEFVLSCIIPLVRATMGLAWPFIVIKAHESCLWQDEAIVKTNKTGQECKYT